MTTSIYYNDTLVAETCYLCGVPFGMPSELQANRLRDRRNFWCPNGHQQHYTGQTEAQKLKLQLADKEREIDYHKGRVGNANDRADTAQRSANAFKGHLKRTKNRVKHGVCPCCNRTFQNLAAHMGTQHPDYAEAK